MCVTVVNTKLDLIDNMIEDCIPSYSLVLFVMLISITVSGCLYSDPNLVTTLATSGPCQLSSS